MEHSNITPHESGLAGETLFSAQDLRKVMMKHQMTEFAKEEAREREMAQARAERVKQFRNPIEITEETLANFMRRVQQAADHGDRQTLILRFPSDLCTDSGRAINNALESWEKTLVGSPKQIYDVWAEKLKPRGFGLHAEVLDYPHGMPGDIGLFCRW